MIWGLGCGTAGHVSPGDTLCSAVWADTEVRGGHQYPDGRVQAVLRVTSGVQANRAQFFINRPLPRRQLNVICYQTKLENQIQPTENHKKHIYIIILNYKLLHQSMSQTILDNRLGASLIY